MMQKPLGRVRAMSKLFVTALFALSMLAASMAPLLTQTAQAKPEGASNLNLIKRGTIVGVTEPAHTYPYATCKPKFTNILKTRDFLKQHFYADVDKIPGFPNPSDDQLRNYLGRQSISTYIGGFGARDFDTVKYILSGVGSDRVPTLVFYATDNLSANAVNSGQQTRPDNDGICDSLVAVRVSATEWRGWQIQNLKVTPSNKYMTFKLGGKSGENATGSLNHVAYDGSTSNGGSVKTVNIQVDGYPEGGSGGVSTGTIHPAWVDASTISIPNNVGNGQFGKDIYKKHQWGGDNADKTAYYFLDSAGNSSRSAITWGSGRGCDRPLPEGSNCNGNGEANCVPFIAVKQFLDFSTDDANQGLPRLKNDVNQLPTAQATLYDYNPTDCRLVARLRVNSFANAQNAKVWFYYSKQQDAFRPVWQAAGGNESVYITNYTLKSGVYQGGDTGCNASVKITSPPAPRGDGDPMYGVDWSLYDKSCQNHYGTLAVYAIGGTAGEAGYSGISESGDGIPVVKEPRIGCDFFVMNALNWLVCPLIKGATNLVAMFDDAISRRLDVDVKPIFDDKTETGRAYHAAWGVFRIFALGLIAIAALVMVISQAAGLEFLDPYIIKKVMPRLLLAAVGITFSWELTELAVTISNDLGNGIRSIIYAPFGSLPALGQLGNGAKFATLLLTTGAIVAYGWFAMLSLVLTAALAMFVAFALLAFREILIIFLVMIAPIAIACSILPNTEKAWNMWKTTFIGALLVFVIFSAFVATGHVFSATAATGGTLSQLIAIIAYFAPYFLIPLIFRLAGGFVATIGGIVNDRSRGLFDGLKNFRRGQLSDRAERWQDGSLYRENRMSRPINALGRRVGAAKAGAGITAFGVGARSRKALSYYEGAIGEKALKRNELLSQLQNDDDANAIMALSGGSLAGAQQAARDLFTDEHGVYDEARGSAAIAGARAVGVNRANANAALKTVMKNKARAIKEGNVRAVDRGVRRLARTQDEYEGMSYTVAYFARESGRGDLGGTEFISYNKDNAAWQRARAVAPTDEMRQWQTVADSNMLDGLKRMGINAIVAGHTNQVKQTMDTLVRMFNAAEDGSEAKVQAAIALKEVQGSITAASGDVRDVINSALYLPQDQGGLGLNPQDNISGQLAERTGRAGLTGQGLTTMGRTWQEYVQRELSAADLAAMTPEQREQAIRELEQQQLRRQQGSQ